VKLKDFVNQVRNHPDFGPSTIHHHYLPPSEARYETMPELEPTLRRLLQEIGIPRLYIHQVSALRRLKEGAHVLVSTPTASGKSLIYNLAVLEKILQEGTARALYLFPLKALEQDQMKSLSPLLALLKGRNITADIYDGDTSPYRRKQIRSRIPHILFTNPDMLHSGILPYHENWKAFFSNLSFVVLDEVHTYRGIFGSHMNQILRRLKRLCALYGTSPRFILLSATIANPKEFGEALTGEEVQVVASSGSPRAGQHFLFLNPDASANFSAARLFSYCLKAGFRTIAFTQSRKVTELIHIWVSQLSPALREKVSSYRAGFMPEERREIEAKLADGRLLGVVSTSALEMGIDIGHLDICLLVGYPGTIITTWQRGGRVGRAGRDSLVILVAKPDALDQYFMKHPQELFGRSYEAAILDPRNPYVLEDHLPCAADERPITLKDDRFWPEDLTEHLERLEEKGRLTRTAEGDPLWLAVRKNPHLGVNIRSAGETYTIFLKETGEAIGTIDGVRALKECHPGAVYLHRGRHYLVDVLDITKGDVIARKAQVRYFTRAMTEKETEIVRVHRSMPRGQFVVREGILKVTEKVTGYEKRALPGQELMGTFTLDLPPQTFETVGFWVEIEPVIRAWIEGRGLHFMGGIHAIEHGAIGIFPLFALCDRNDIGGICYPYHPQVEKSAIFIYDGYPGGVGLAQRGFEMVLELLEKTLELIETCECEEGCPSCIHSPKCGAGNKPLDKKAAAMILKCLVGRIPLSTIAGESALTGVPDARGGLAAERPEEQESVPRVLFLDLETQRLAQEVGGWKNTHLMGISVAVVYDSIEEDFITFTEERIGELIERLETADLVVGFNLKRFDYGVLSAYTDRDLEALNTFDILEDIHRRIGFRLGLDHLARETLNQGKSADGIQAVEWFRKGQLEKVVDYCRRDVAVTRDLFLHGLDKGYLVYRRKKEDRRVRLRVDWKLEDLIKSCGKR